MNYDPFAPQDIGVFGGAFDPVHMGHVWLVGWALSAVPINKLLIVPCWKHGLGKQMSKFEHRYQMCVEAFSIYGDKVAVTGIEQDRGIQYTSELLGDLKNRYPRDRFHLFVGADEYESLVTRKEWHQSEEILRFATVHAMGREGQGAVGAPVLPNISSGALRESHRKYGTFPCGQVPRKVERYVELAGLYK